MLSKQIDENKKDDLKETMKKEIAHLLSRDFPVLKESLGEKKFEKLIKKTAKLISEAFKKGRQNQAPAIKSPVKKAAPKKSPLISKEESIKKDTPKKVPVTKSKAGKSAITKK